MALLRFYRMIAIFLWEMLRLHPSSTPIFLHPDVATATSYFHFTPIPLFSASALLCFSSSSFSSIFFFSSSQRRHTHPLTGEETSTAPRNLRLCLRHSLSLSLSLSLAGRPDLELQSPIQSGKMLHTAETEDPTSLRKTGRNRGHGQTPHTRG
jgi:hypothetical protein